MKTLIVDGQMWQTNAFFRGMGGYAFGLLSALSLDNPNLKLHIVLNKNMNHDGARLKGIESWLPDAKIHILDLPFEPKPESGEEERATGELDRFITALGVDPIETFYFMPALFMFQYCAVFPSGVRKILLFHDLMPLIYREELGKYFPGHIYFPRFKMVFEADLIVTNSQTTAVDLLAYLGVAQEKVVNIDGSLNERLVHDDGAAQQGPEGILNRLHLQEKPYIMMPTGGLENKNNIRATEAFRQLCDNGDAKTQLVVTSFFDDLAKRELQLIAHDRITFTGIISNEELLTLYTDCSAVLMPSLYEGLGLPVLEGVAHGNPVACADVPVFREIPHFKQALYTFDPFDVEAIATALQEALDKREFEAKRKHYPVILAKYNWKRSARIFAEALQDGSYFKARQPVKRKKFAVLCPDPRKNNDVAVFAQRMYGYAQRAGIELVYFLDPGGGDEPGETLFPDYIRSLALCYDIDDVYAKLRDESFDGAIHFAKPDAHFVKLSRAIASIPGYVYISDNGYAPLVNAMANNKMISQSQADATNAIIDKCRKENAFDGMGLVASAQGFIVEKPLGKVFVRALSAFGLNTPYIVVGTGREVNSGEGGDVDAKQQKAYDELFTFIGGKK